jgi:23S rRNA (adenine2030-N6)-methyltransferase
MLLKREFAGDQAVEVRQADGYHAIKATLPPVERRALVLIDPPFEATDEFEVLTRAVRHGLRRFATGCYAVWYPIKDEAAVASFFASLAEEKYLRLELDLGPRTPEGKLAACGLVVINSPWKFEEAMREALPWIAARLGDGARSHLFASPASTPAQA